MPVVSTVTILLPSVVTGTALLVLLVMSVTRLPRPWAVLGVLAGALGLVSVGWEVVRNVSLLLGHGPADYEVFYYGPLAAIVGLIGLTSTVLLVAAVLVGRREKPVDHSGPTGTTFRQLPGGVRWE